MSDDYTTDDLRAALARLEGEDAPRRIAEPVQADCELAALYARAGGGVPVAPPTRKGPPLLFERVQPQGAPVLVGLFGTRGRCAALLGCPPDRVADRLIEAARAPVAPAAALRAACQEQVERRSVDLGRVPVPTMTADDAGPFLTLGLVVARDPASGARNISIHRMCVQGPDRVTIWMVPGRHLETFYLNARARGQSLPVAIHIGLDPAVYLASCCTSPLAALGCDELGIAGGLRGRPVGLAPCVSQPLECIANAEYVLEGEISSEITPESRRGGGSMPEFLGYNGRAHPGLPVVRITAVCQRRDAIFQTVIGPGYEQSNMLALGMEAGVLHFLRQNVTPRALNAYCSSAGGGQLLLFLQMRKTSDNDDGVARQAALAVLGTFRMIKQIVLVDEDVDVFSEEDVWWAMTTRFQADQDLMVLRNVQGFPLDPSQHPDVSPSISSPGLTAKAVFDCTVPFRLRARFQRSLFPWPLPEQNPKEQ